MKIYLVVHSINEALQLPSYCEILSAHTTKEKAMEKIEKIRKEVVNGISKYFGEEIPEVSLYPGEEKGYTYKWEGEGKASMYSHFYIKTTKLEEGE